MNYGRLCGRKQTLTRSVSDILKHVFLRKIGSLVVKVTYVAVINVRSTVTTKKCFDLTQSKGVQIIRIYIFSSNFFKFG